MSSNRVKGILVGSVLGQLAFGGVGWWLMNHWLYPYGVGFARFIRESAVVFMSIHLVGAMLLPKWRIWRHTAIAMVAVAAAGCSTLSRYHHEVALAQEFCRSAAAAHLVPDGTGMDVKAIASKIMAGGPPPVLRAMNDRRCCVVERSGMLTFELVDLAPAHLGSVKSASWRFLRRPGRWVYDLFPFDYGVPDGGG